MEHGMKLSLINFRDEIASCLAMTLMLKVALLHTLQPLAMRLMLKIALLHALQPLAMRLTRTLSGTPRIPSLRGTTQSLSDMPLNFVLNSNLIVK
ncbi:hypothetical protein SAMN04489864_10160 [Pedobacter insulae]|uniref:Uncharacterized protein n=1 Tax=Pedobacter insulae TaxID=414048 RepID=A0A1I2SUW0_9SPHI|nr:hypothetical protein SAMN04489864_10160 [Pedobacter insulae]